MPKLNQTAVIQQRSSMPVAGTPQRSSRQGNADILFWESLTIEPLFWYEDVNAWKENCALKLCKNFISLSFFVLRGGWGGRKLWHEIICEPKWKHVIVNGKIIGVSITAINRIIHLCHPSLCSVTTTSRPLTKEPWRGDIVWNRSEAPGPIRLLLCFSLEPL